MELTLPIDEDWEVRVLVAPDLSTVVIYNVQTDDEIRLEGSWDRLHLLGTVIAGDLKALHGDTEVTGNGRNPDAVVSAPYKTRTLDAIDQKIENLETILSDYRAEKGEEGRYPQDFRKGDWVRFPPTRTWRQISRVREGATNNERVVMYQFGGAEYGQQVRNVTRYPYMTAAAMAAVPEQEAR